MFINSKPNEVIDLQTGAPIDALRAVGQGFVMAISAGNIFLVNRLGVVVQVSGRN